MFDWDHPEAWRRAPVLADNVVATSQPLAAQAGLEMLQRGGNAIDAAIAAAIALTVVEPTSNGIGGDAFALVWDGSQLLGLNGSGKSPRRLTRDHLGRRRRVPELGWLPVTVPGAPSAWWALSDRLGRLDFTTLFEPAIRCAEDGFLVSPITAVAWARAARRFRDFPDFAATFLPDGRAPMAGERFRAPGQAATLIDLAQTQTASLYTGTLAQALVAHARATAGLIDGRDLAEHAVDWVQPLTQRCAGVDLHELPPNGQGIAALVAAGILDRLGGATTDGGAAGLHAQIESMKLGFADAARYVADPATLDLAPTALLDPGYLDERAALVDPRRAQVPRYGTPRHGGTVYLAAADSDGMMVSFIQSNFEGFGSGIVVPGTGISLQNRGAGFCLAAGHPNVIAGGKRPFHTIIPGFLTSDNRPLAAFGVMGGPMQPQGHLQLLARIAGNGEHPQAAIDAPRWRIIRGRQLLVEAGMPARVVRALERRGHEVRRAPFTAFGGAQLVWRLASGYVGASEPRKDGHAVGW